MVRPFFAFACLAAESSRVVELRLHKLGLGGVPAWEEYALMVMEKIRASHEAARHLTQGRSLESVVADYRTIVRANIRRLSD